MGNKNRKTALRAIFVLALLGVIWGWLLVIRHMIQNDVKVAETRVREAEERYLSELAVNLDWLGLDPAGVSDQLVFNTVERDLASGVWSDRLRAGIGNNNQPVLAWPGVSASTSAELLERESEFSWGHVDDGRDRLGALLLKLARQEGEEFKGRDLLMLGVMSSYHPGNTVNPGFRLLMIKEASRGNEDPLSRRLQLAEEIRAVEGRVEELHVPLEELRKGDVSVFFNREQTMNLIRAERDVELELTSSPPENRNWIRVPEFKHWPFLSLKEGLPAGGSAIVESEQTVRNLGYLTMISTLAVIGLAIWIGRRELKRARARTDLAASVAHELRTPLAGQRVILESLQQKKEYDEEYLSMALKENERLGDLAEEFLTFSRLERGVLEVQLKPLNLAEVIEPVVAGFQEQWGEEIDCRLDDSPVLADEAAVATIARNLIENAWKYSDEPRKISVSSVRSDSEVGFSVGDNGIGLSKSDQARIFKQFYRVDQRLSRSREGLGIGLSIVRRLIEALDGRLEVDSELGKGSTFSVYLKKGGKA